MKNIMNINSMVSVENFEELQPTACAFGATKLGTPSDGRLQTVFCGEIRHKQCLTIVSSVNGKSKYSWQIIRQEETAAIRAGYLPIAKYSFGYTSTKNSEFVKMPWKNFTTAQITLSVSHAVNDNGEKLVTDLIGKDFILVNNGEKCWLYRYDGGDALINVASGKEMSLKTVKQWADSFSSKNKYKIDAGLLPEPIIWYMSGTTSTSQQRKGDLELFRKDYALGNRINTLTGGGLDILKMVYSKPQPANKAIKLASRLSLPETNSAFWGNCNAVAVFAGEWKYNGVAFADGTVTISEKLFKRGAKDKGYKFKHNAGTVIQCRNAFIKGCGDVVSKFVMKEIIANYCDGTNIVLVNIDDNRSVIKAMVDIQSGEIENKVVIFAKISKHSTVSSILDQIDLFVDKNALKASFDLTKKPDFFVMEMAHLSHGVNTSSQIVAGAVRGKNFMENFLSIAKENIDKKFIIPQTPKEVNFSELGSDDFAEDLLWKINPTFIKSIPSVKRSLKTKISKSCLNKINNLSFKVDGWYLKGVADAGCFFGKALLHKNEVYVPGVYLVDGKVGMLFRHPKMAEGEFAKVTYVSKQTLLDRIKTLELSSEAEIALAERVSNLAPGAIMLPSWDKYLAAKLGGADYDGDGFDFIIDSRIVETYSELQEGAIQFGKDEPSKSLISIDDQLVNNAYLASVMNGNYDVGQLVTFGYKMRAVKADIEIGKLDQEKWDSITNAGKETCKYLPKIEEISGTVSKKVKEIFYEGKPAYSSFLVEKAAKGEEIDGKAVEEFGVKVYSSDFYDLNSFYAILCDLEIAMASVVGRNIDAVKTGARVFCPLFALSQMFKSGIKAQFAYDSDSDKWEYPKHGVFKIKESGIGYATCDPCYQLKWLAVEYFKEQINKF